MAIDKLESTPSPGNRFDCPICGKPATSYMLNYEKGKQIATYMHRARVNPKVEAMIRSGAAKTGAGEIEIEGALRFLASAEDGRKCRVPVLHG